MELTHTFTVPVDRDTAWAAFQDVGSVAECFPGATVTSAEGDAFEGTVKVKLGPIALQYAGSGRFVERDASAYRLAIEAKGRDKRGNGTAGADVTATFAEDPAGGSAGGPATRVEVRTELQITGKPAQFGRGVIQDVSDKLLGQFLDCLESRIAPPPPSAESARLRDEDTPPPSAGSARAREDEAAPPGPEDQPPVVAGLGQEQRPGADAIDVGATVVPVLLRSYGPQLLGVLVVVALLVRWLRRRA